MKKLALIAAVIVITVIALHRWPTHDETAAPAPATTATPTVPVAPTTAASTTPAATATPSTGGPYGGTARARRQWEPTVQGFALAYPDTSGLTRKKWLMNLRPFVDGPVIDALSTTDLQKVPRGHYAGYQPLKLADEVITVRVTYQEGWALDLHLASTGRSWSVSRFDVAADFD
jgi:hypothetical protein